MTRSAHAHDTLVAVLPHGKTKGRPIAPLGFYGEDGATPAACRKSRYGAKPIPVMGRVPRTARLHLAGELGRVGDFVDPIREQMDAGITRILVTIDELSMDGEVGLLALEDIRALRAECGAVIIWSRDPLECFRMPVA